MYLGTKTQDPSANRLLRSLSSGEYERLFPRLHRVNLRLGDVISNAMDRLSVAYFPTSSILSLVGGTQDGATAEIALIGNDGVLGTSLFLGGGRATSSAIVGVAGEAYRMEAHDLRDEFGRCGTFQRILLRYTDALMGQISLTAACNCTHPLEKRFCRWLLLLRDRAPSDQLVMTQEFIAHLLGGRRETVTVAAGRLQDAGMIRYARGRITIVDRIGLEKSVCECYLALKAECDRIFIPDGAERRQPAFEVFSRSSVGRAIS
jgi:CRP-like cAMP-binding protein